VDRCAWQNEGRLSNPRLITKTKEGFRKLITEERKAEEVAYRPTRSTRRRHDGNPTVYMCERGRGRDKGDNT